jgi:hypothetical protein
VNEDEYKNDLNGPICESWFLAITVPSWLDYGAVCPHDSCWHIMTWNSEDVGGWFRERADQV